MLSRTIFSTARSSPSAAWYPCGAAGFGFAVGGSTSDGVRVRGIVRCWPRRGPSSHSGHGSPCPRRRTVKSTGTSTARGRDLGGVGQADVGQGSKRHSRPESSASRKACRRSVCVVPACGVRRVPFRDFARGASRHEQASTHATCPGSGQARPGPLAEGRRPRASFGVTDVRRSAALRTPAECVMALD